MRRTRLLSSGALFTVDARLEARPDQIVKEASVGRGILVGSIRRVASGFGTSRGPVVRGTRIRRSCSVSALALLLHNCIALLLLQAAHTLARKVLLRQNSGHVWGRSRDKRRGHERARAPEVERVPER